MSGAMVKFKVIDKSGFLLVATSLFDILHANMDLIVPTGNNYEEDCEEWIENVHSNLSNGARKIILILYKEALIGFYMYSLYDGVLNMEEIQIAEDYQNKYGIFRELFGFVISSLPHDIKTVVSCAQKKNKKSHEIQKHIGLNQISKDHKYLYFQGTYTDLLKWYYRN
jgi:hypothetical protein